MSADPLNTVGTLATAWSASATVCLRHAHNPDNGLSPTAKAVFAGRADAYQNCAEVLRLVISSIRVPSVPAIEADLDAALAILEKNIDPR